jgi:hypothetical protein
MVKAEAGKAKSVVASRSGGALHPLHPVVAPAGPGPAVPGLCAVAVGNESHE